LGSTGISPPFSGLKNNLNKELALSRQQEIPKGGLILSGVHGVISLKIELFMTTAVRTSNITMYVGSQLLAALLMKSTYFLGCDAM
jgi:hypothetical protein